MRKLDRWLHQTSALLQQRHWEVKDTGCWSLINKHQWNGVSFWRQKMSNYKFFLILLKRNNWKIFNHFCKWNIVVLVICICKFKSWRFLLCSLNFDSPVFLNCIYELMSCFYFPWFLSCRYTALNQFWWTWQFCLVGEPWMHLQYLNCKSLHVALPFPHNWKYLFLLDCYTMPFPNQEWQPAE